MGSNKIAHEVSIYSYFAKLKTWRNYATKNSVPFDCEKCKKVHAHKTVLLDDGSHICWFCWIKKQQEIVKVVKKPQSIIDTKSETKSNSLVPVIESDVANIGRKSISSDHYYDNVKQCFYEVCTSKKNTVSSKKRAK